MTIETSKELSNAAVVVGTHSRAIITAGWRMIKGDKTTQIDAIVGFYLDTGGEPFVNMSSAQARCVAATLIAAADELDRK